MRVFFDTNVLVYTVDRAQPARRSIAIDLLAQHVRERSLVLSTQVLQEFYSVAVRRRLMDPADALEMVGVLAREPVVPSSGEFVVRAIALGQRHQLSSWDALIVQAALDAQCDALLSEDLGDGTRFGELRIVNPFASAAHEAGRPSARPAGASATPSPGRSRPARRKREEKS